MSQRRDVLKAAGAAAGAMSLPSAFAQGLPVIERDVCVVGGGSAGTYTAVRLRDLGRSVVVVERTGRLGGHAETYVDPASGAPIDIGVVVLENNPLVNAYLARFGVAGVPIQFPPGDTRYVDFRSGRVVDGYAPPERTALGLFAYQRVLASRFPYLDQGFVLPDPVPPDLWLPTRAFIQKYRLDAIVPTLWDFGQGIGNLLEVPALYTLKLVGLSVMNAILGIDGSGFLLLPQGTSQLYLAATAALGSDLLLNTSVRRATRSDGRVELVVDTPQGPALVRARQLVVAIPPTLSNLAGFGLDPLESATFGRLRPQCYATAVVRLSGLPAGVSLRNTGADTEFNLPPLPGLYGLTPTGAPGLWNLKYGAAGPLPADTLRQNIRDDLARVASAGTFPLVLESIEIFKDHTPFQMMVSTRDIAAGYYRSVESLQGRRSTWFHSAAFQTNNSSRLWQRTEALLPLIAA